MNKAEEFFQSLEIESEGNWWSNPGKWKNSGVNIGDDGGPCLAKIGKYHIFSNCKKKNPTRWIVNTETKEVRRVSLPYKLKELKEIFRP